ncbi:MAG: hypothetical protein LAO22_17880 [Acidobacteriia bacterium]|nr:hypothetical protein [Terriglobia bacterium]
MKRLYLVAITAVILGLALAGLTGPTVMANNRDEPQVFDRDSVAYGRTYGEWMAAWNQWSFSLPVSGHPLFTDGDCSVGQSGPVWFLGGAFIPPSTRVRHCNVPSGKALFFPVVDWEDSTLEESVVEHPGDATYQQIVALRSFVESGLEGVTGPYCEIDYQRIPHLAKRFRVQSPVFGFTIPENNLLNVVYGTTFEAGTYFPAVDDGWDVMLAPLPPGDHVLHFGSNWNDITYYLHVAK